MIAVMHAKLEQDVINLCKLRGYPTGQMQRLIKPLADIYNDWHKLHVAQISECS